MGTKDEIKGKAQLFLATFAQAVARAYGPQRAAPLLGEDIENPWAIEPEHVNIDDMPLWRALTVMYDYGVEGLPHPSFGSGTTIDGIYADAEMFLTGAASFQPLLEEDHPMQPAASLLRVVRTAVARHVLEGGERYAVFDEGLGASGMLTIAEVALLARMDERSARNEAGKGALVTTVLGRRTGVTIADAKAWLSTRRGFRPTQLSAVQGTSTAAAEDAAVTFDDLLMAPADQLEVVQAVFGLIAAGDWLGARERLDAASEAASDERWKSAARSLAATCTRRAGL